MRARLWATATRLAVGAKPLGPPGLEALAPAAGAAQPALAAPWPRPWHVSGVPKHSEYGVLACGATAAEATAAGAMEGDEDLGDLKPGMSVEDEEEDEAEHYSLRAHVHRRRLRQREEHHLDEEDTPLEEAPGEEAYKEAGPLLPPDEDEEDVLTDEEEEARK